MFTSAIRPCPNKSTRILQCSNITLPWNGLQFATNSRLSKSCRAITRQPKNAPILASTNRIHSHSRASLRSHSDTETRLSQLKMRLGYSTHTIEQRETLTDRREPRSSVIVFGKAHLGGTYARSLLWCPKKQKRNQTTTYVLYVQRYVPPWSPRRSDNQAK